MCGELVSCVEFRAILTPFSEVIRKPDKGVVTSHFLELLLAAIL